MIVEFVVFSLTFTIIYLIYKHKSIHTLFEDRNVKFNPGVPVFGNLFRSTFLNRHFVEDIDAVYKEFPNEKYVGFIERTTPIIIIRDPEIIRNITVTHFSHFLNHKPVIPDDVERLFGYTLFMMKDKKWRDMRSTMSPFFTAAKIKQIVTFATEISEDIVKHLKDHTCEYIDVNDLMRRYTNDVINGSIFGIRLNSIKHKQNDLYKTGQAVTNIKTFQRILMVLISLFPGIIKIFSIEIFPAKALRFFIDFVKKRLDVNDTNETQRQDLIQHLSQTSKDWTVEELTGQVFFFFLAGFESLASTLTLCVHELAVYPDVQEKLYHEIKTARDKDDLSYENISNLQYLDCVINETLRKWSPGLFLDRVCTQPYELPPPREGAKPCKLKPGDIIYNALNSLHLDPEYFPDPYMFNPDRFSNENKHEIKPYTFMPFGVGPRNCIASRYTMFVMKALICQLVLNFNIVKCEKTSDPIYLKPHEFSIKAKGDTWVKLEKRT